MKWARPRPGMPSKGRPAARASSPFPDGAAMREKGEGAKRLRGMHSILPFGQGVELKFTALVPQPGVGVGELADACGRREGCGSAHGAFDLCHHFRSVARRAHPGCAQHAASGIDIHLQHPNGIEQRRQAAWVDARRIQAVEMGCGVLAVSARVAGGRGARRASCCRDRAGDVGYGAGWSRFVRRAGRRAGGRAAGGDDRCNGCHEPGAEPSATRRSGRWGVGIHGSRWRGA